MTNLGQHPHDHAEHTTGDDQESDRVRIHHRSSPKMTVTDTTKISCSAPTHRSHTIEFGANVPNRLQRGRPNRCENFDSYWIEDLRSPRFPCVSSLLFTPSGGQRRSGIG